MAELVPVSPITLDLLASLADSDQLLAIVDPTGTPSLGRSPVSGLDLRYALLDATNVTPATWRAAVGVPSGVIHVANEAARLALAGRFNGQLVIQDDTEATWSLINDADPSNAASWDDLTVSSIAWADITGKPSTFAPSAHTQTASTITDFATAVGLLAQPVVGGATEDNIATFDGAGFVQDGGVAIGDVIVEGDARLTDARTPVAHNQAFSTITGTIVQAQFPAGSANQFLRRNLAGTAIEWVSIPGGGDLLSTNNLSDLTDAAAARVNLDLEIGVDVQAYDAMLDELSALTSPGADRILFWDNSTANLDWLVPSANFAITTTNLDLAATVMLKADNLSGLANTGTSRTNLGVAIGTDVQAHDPFLDDIAALTDPGADRLMFWDDSVGDIVWLTLGTGLTITDTTLDSAAGGTVTNTGGDLTANSVVLGAGAVDTKIIAGITTDGTAQLVLGVDTTTLGSVKLFGNTSGDATISPAAVAGTATALTLPATSGTLALAGAAPAAHAASHVNGTDDIQDATAAQKGLMTAAYGTKLDGIEAAADVTDATNVNAAGAVMESDFDANTILAATADNTPTIRTIAESDIVGRLPGGEIAGITSADLTEEATPAAGDFLVGWESGGAIRKFDVGDLPGGGGGYDTVEDDGTPVTQRSTINFTGAGVSTADAGGKTVVTIAGGGGSGTVNMLTIQSFT